MFSYVIPLGLFIISSIYVAVQVWLAAMTALQERKAYETDWYIYNTTAEFYIDHVAFWFYFIIWLYSLHVIITGGYAL